MSKLRFCLGVFLWVVLGFIVGQILVGLGAIIAFSTLYIPLWKIAIMTLIGMSAVMLYIIEEIKNEKE